MSPASILVAVSLLLGLGSAGATAADQPISLEVPPALGINLAAGSEQRVSGNTDWTVTTEVRAGGTIITVVPR